MNSRKNFLAGLFRRLDAKAIAYCVLRNYEDLYADGAAADIDLILEKRDLPRFNDSLQIAAAEAGHRLVHRARFINHSRVFWSAQSDFIRIDFDTEMRWRLFPILSARAMLDARKPRENFFVPDPRHESVVLFTQAIWLGGLSERYRRQLARLYEACGTKEELRRTYLDAFGSAGMELAEFHARIKEREFDAALCSRLKRSVILKTISRPSAWRDFAANTLDDAGRLWQRVRQPAGISLTYFSSLKEDARLDAFMRRVEFLFPTQKSMVHNSASWPARLGIALQWRRLRALFKGGMFVQFCRLATDADLVKAFESGWGGLYPSRCFFCAEDSRQRTRLAHVGSGCRADSEEEGGGDKTDFSALLIGFIATVLEREQAAGRAK